MKALKRTSLNQLGKIEQDIKDKREKLQKYDTKIKSLKEIISNNERQGEQILAEIAKVEKEKAQI